MKTYANPIFPYQPSPDQSAKEPVHHPVVIVGAGPVGLCAAIDLAQYGAPAVLLDDDDTVSVGSRAICYSQRTLEILDRLGCGEAVAARGVSWNVGKVFLGERLLYSFNLLPQSGYRRPAFVNLQQYYLEEILVRRAQSAGGVDLRWKNKVIGVEPGDSSVLIKVETPAGVYTLNCDWLIACDGARSAVRRLMGLASKGEVFKDRFLITDVVMEADYPPERWFWFDPPFNPGRSALLHRQADNVWRIDFSLGQEADPVKEQQPERVKGRLRQMLGQRRFEPEWVSLYTFSCKRLEKFRYGRVFFAGDAAHQMSPFGARGANSGIQDAENLAWKLKLVLAGAAPERLLDTYCEERVPAAEENLLATIRSTEFIAPQSPASRSFRDAVLLLAENHPFARALVNSGRLSRPAVLRDSSLNTPDVDAFSGAMVPGAPAADAPVVTADGKSWLLQCLGGEFNGLYFAAGMQELANGLAEEFSALRNDAVGAAIRVVVEKGSRLIVPAGIMRIEDKEGLMAQRYDASPGAFYLFRPDQHVCARWRKFDRERVRAAVGRATCNE